jgi:hypothetical protein
MAKQKNMHYAGRVGNIVYYELNGGYYLRTVPARVRQTAATKRRSSNFSFAVGASRVLRALLLPALPFPKDKKMQNRFGGAIMKWLKLQTIKQLASDHDLPFIQNFQFNDKTDLRGRWKIPMQVTKAGEGLLQLSLPAFVPVEKMAAPTGTLSVTCNLAAASCTLKNSVPNGNAIHSFSIPYTSEEMRARIIDLPVPMPAGSLVVVALSLTCLVAGKTKTAPSANIAFRPSGIVGSMYVL